MALTEITNGKLTAVISDKGAELQSLVYGGIEYIWQGDPKYWNRRAPVLFPFVGRCKNDAYTYAGGTYHIGQHGFARDSVFEVVAAGGSSASFSLKSNPELKKKYPFDFEFVITYRLQGTTLAVEYEVMNRGNSMMFFSVGSHEAYRCPLVDGERFEDYTIQLNQNERLDRYYLEDGLAGLTGEPFIDFGQELPLSHEYFRSSAAVLKDVKSTSVTLRSGVSGHGVTVGFEGFPNLGLWQPYGAPFLCIEPWLGLSDGVNFNGELPNKAYIQRVNAGASRTCTHMITLF